MAENNDCRDEYTDLATFLKTGEFKATDRNGRPVVNLFDSDWCCASISPVLFGTVDLYLKDRLASDNPDILVVLNASGVQSALLNADMVTEDVSDITEGLQNLPQLSFKCLMRLVDRKNGENATLGKLSKAAQHITLLDFTAQQTKELTASEKKLHKKNKLKNGEKRGQWTLTGGKWHTPSTVLLQYKDKCFLFGQDEGTYFGLEMTGTAQTIDEAYTLLAPQAARNVRGVLRQGEWFAIPVKAKNVPAEKDCIAGGSNSIRLPLETPESNIHEFYVHDDANIRIHATGLYVRDFDLRHDQHATLHGDEGQWYVFARNTAKHSVSQEGVD